MPVDVSDFGDMFPKSKKKSNVDVSDFGDMFPSKPTVWDNLIQPETKIDTSLIDANTPEKLKRYLTERKKSPDYLPTKADRFLAGLDKMEGEYQQTFGDKVAGAKKIKDADAIEANWKNQVGKDKLNLIGGFAENLDSVVASAVMPWASAETLLGTVAKNTAIGLSTDIPILFGRNSGYDNAGKRMVQQVPYVVVGNVVGGAIGHGLGKLFNNAKTVKDTLDPKTAGKVDKLDSLVEAGHITPEQAGEVLSKDKAVTESILQHIKENDTPTRATEATQPTIKDQIADVRPNEADANYQLLDEYAKTNHGMSADEFANKVGLEIQNKTGDVGADTVDSLKQFAGVNAKNADLDALAKAQAMTEQGADARQIWKDTGWFFDKDGKWKFEIDDSKSYMRGFPAEGKVLDYQTEHFAHNGLYENYPRTQDIGLWYKELDGAYGNYSAKDKLIKVEPSLSVNDARSVLLHENQHAIQAREGFARGGSIDGMYGNYEKISYDLKQAQLELDQLETQAKNAQNSGYDVWANDAFKDWREKYFAVSDKVNELRDARSMTRKSEGTAEQKYRRLHGEAEARNVQTRMNMTAEERRNSFPHDTFDVPVEDTIVRYGDGNMLHGGADTLFQKGELHEVAVSKAYKILQRMRDEIDVNTLSHEEKNIHSVYHGELNSASIKLHDLNDIINFNHGSRTQGARKILIKHGGEDLAGGLSPVELVRVGEAIRNGKISEESFSETVNGIRYGYDYEKHGIKYRVVVEETNDGKKVIDYYSDRNFIENGKRSYREAGSRPQSANPANKEIINPSELNKADVSQVEINGLVKFGMDEGTAKTTIQIFKGGDVSTLPHELAHVFRRYLPDNMLEHATRIFTKDGTWDVDAEEAFAEGFVKWLSTGKAPTAELKSTFAQFRDWLKDLWRTVMSNEREFKLTQQHKDFYNAMMGDKKAIDKLFSPKSTLDKTAKNASELFQKAPSGSRLAEWHKDSHPLTKNKDGTPKVFYHGTASNFDEFKLAKATDKEGRKRGLGWGKDKFYFADVSEGANSSAEYAKIQGKGKTPNVMPVYLDVKNPISADIYEAKVAELVAQGKSRDSAIKAVDNALKKNGIDGIYDDVSGGVAVFDPTQIKSIHNRGTFDETNPNILMQTSAKEKVSQATSKVKDILNSDIMDVFTGHKVYGEKDYMTMREDMHTAIHGFEEKLVIMSKVLDELSQQAQEALHLAISGDKQLSDEYKFLQPLADEMRTQIDTISESLKGKGIIADSVIDEYLGRYTHRTYGSHLAEEKSGGTPSGSTLPKMFKRGKQLLSDKADEIQSYLSQYGEAKGLAKLDSFNSNIDELIADAESKGYFGNKADGQVSIKKIGDKYSLDRDWTFDERTAMGENRNASYTIPDTLVRLKFMQSVSTFLERVAKSDLVMPLSEAKELGDDYAKSKGYTLLNGSKYGLLDGQWVKNHVANDINNMMFDLHGSHGSSPSLDKVKNGIVKGVSWIKKTHTIYLPKTHFNNIISNAPLLAGAGMNPLKIAPYMGKAMKTIYHYDKFTSLLAKQKAGTATADELSKLNKYMNDKDLMLYYKAKLSGAFGRSHLNDIMQGKAKAITGTAEKQSTLSKIDDFATNVYSEEDNIARFALIKYAVQDHKMSMKQAVELMNKNMADYNKPMSAVAHFSSRYGLVPFISWTYYTAPIMMKQLKPFEKTAQGWKLAKDEFGGNRINNALLLAVLSTSPFIAGHMATNTSMDDLPDDQVLGHEIPVSKKGHKVTTVKADKWNPYYTLMNPVETVSGLSTSSPLFNIGGAIQNFDPFYKRKITQNDGARGYFDRSAKLFQDLVTPDVIDQVIGLGASALFSQEQRRKQKVVDPKTFKQQLLNTFINTHTYNADKIREERQAQILKDRKNNR